MYNFTLILFTQIIPFIPIALAIVISYSIMRLTDLTLDSSFIGGASIFALLITSNINIIFAILFAMFYGALCGITVGLIQANKKINDLLAGILTNFMFTSIILIIIGKPNISLLNYNNAYTNILNNYPLKGLLINIFIILLLISFLFILITSKFGLKIRAIGQNYNLAKNLGINVELYKISGLILTNILATISGILTSLQIGYSDINMGTGVTLTGIAAIIIGYQLTKKIKFKNYFNLELVATLIGVFIYFSAINLLLKFDLDPIYLKPILTIILVMFLRLPSLRKI
jgi:putative ABC transport system permease protein